MFMNWSKPRRFPVTLRLAFSLTTSKARRTRVFRKCRMIDGPTRGCPSSGGAAGAGARELPGDGAAGSGDPAAQQRAPAASPRPPSANTHTTGAASPPHSRRGRTRELLLHVLLQVRPRLRHLAPQPGQLMIPPAGRAVPKCSPCFSPRIPGTRSNIYAPRPPLSTSSRLLTPDSQ